LPFLAGLSGEPSIRSESTSPAWVGLKQQTYQYNSAPVNSSADKMVGVLETYKILRVFVCVTVFSVFFMGLQLWSNNSCVHTVVQIISHSEQKLECSRPCHLY